MLLFFHVLAVAMLFSGITLEVTGFARLHRAITLAEARAATANFALVGPLMGGGSLILIIAGVAMVYVTGFGWSPAWISVTAIMTIVLAINGPLLNGRRCEHISKLANTGADGPITPELDRARNDGLLTYSLFLTLCVLIAALFMMTVKPGVSGCITSVVLAALTALIPAALIVRRRALAVTPS